MQSPNQIPFYVVVFYFFTSAVYGSTILTMSANFTKGKAVSTSHTTIQPYSKIQCAEKCFEEGRYGRCSVAGYNKALKACYLSVDTPQDVVDVADDMSGVYFIKNGESSVYNSVRRIAYYSEFVLPNG